MDFLCKLYFIFIFYSCEKCEIGCTTCSALTGGRKVCTKCSKDSGYYLHDGVCLKKRKGCTNRYNESTGECEVC